MPRIPAFRSTRSTHLLLRLVGVLALVAGSGFASDAIAQSASAAVVQGQGKWVNNQPCVTTFFDPTTGDLACTGPSIWHGPLEGTTEYHFQGVVSANGDAVGTIDETFTGSASNGAQGTIHFSEFITISGATGAVSIRAVAVGGTGTFCSVMGNLNFTGVSDANGLGTGTYQAHIVIPRNCRR